MDSSINVNIFVDHGHILVDSYGHKQEYPAANLNSDMGTEEEIIEALEEITQRFLDELNLSEGDRITVTSMVDGTEHPTYYTKFADGILRTLSTKIPRDTYQKFGNGDADVQEEQDQW